MDRLHSEGEDRMSSWVFDLRRKGIIIAYNEGGIGRVFALSFFWWPRVYETHLNREILYIYVRLRENTRRCFMIRTFRCRYWNPDRNEQ